MPNRTLLPLPSICLPRIAHLAGLAMLLALAACSTPAPIVQSRPADVVIGPDPEPEPAAVPAAPPPRVARKPLLRPPRMRGGGYFSNDGPGDNPPANLASIPDAVPRKEALSPQSNQPYTVFGQRYAPMTALQPFRQRGVASWYGRKFHGRRTANGETYNMYGMTAAHPTLPLPCFVKVTSIETGRSVVVRVNDRGPFLNGRAIDLSYTAAYKLGYLESGFAQIELELVMTGDFPDRPAGPTLAGVSPGLRSTAVKGIAMVSPQAPGYLRLASFGSPQSAVAGIDRIAAEFDLPLNALALAFDGQVFQIRVGPYLDPQELEAAQRALQAWGEDGDRRDAAQLPAGAAVAGGASE